MTVLIIIDSGRSDQLLQFVSASVLYTLQTSLYHQQCESIPHDHIFVLSMHILLHSYF